MTQEQAVIETIRRLGGVATLTQINHSIFDITECKWNTKTPFASIRAIVQRSPKYIYKIKPGMYGLVEMKKELEENGIIVQTPQNSDSDIVKTFNHTYYQGLLLEIGNRQKFMTYSPNQDKNKKFSGNKTIGELRSCNNLPQFTNKRLLKRAETIDVIWLDRSEIPTYFFEVEHSTDIQNSLLKYDDLRGFSARMIIVADKKRFPEFTKKIHYTAFSHIADKVEFLDYQSLEKQYELVLDYQTLNVGILGL